MDASEIEEERETTSENESSEPESEPEPEGDLRDELYDALKDTESGFSGNFYHCSTDINAPNPGLHIAGLGVIGLPLNHREAQMIIALSARAPFGRGAETVVDTRVRDTWEIEPSGVAFSNPRWQAYVDQLAFKTVWATLGVAPYKNRPRCELYKLLLYQPGSHFLPHQDTAKAPGMFATIVVVLPSAFQGGEVHVSHAGVTKVLDISQASINDTSVLAWYTDVIHEVKPITAGYRLALSYNLIHTSPNVPAPSLPEQMDVTPLRECLEKWNEDGFETVPDTPLVAYLLAHQYSEYDLDKGQGCLKGRDASTVVQLLPVAESLDVVVCLANLTRTVTGYADDNGGRYHRRRRHYYDTDSEDETPCMGEIEEDTYKITNMVQIGDGYVGEVDFGEFTIDQECLIPEEPFDGAKPDGEEYEGYMGNGAGSMSQWYKSSVLIMMRREDVMTIGISLKGHQWGLQRLRLSPSPDPGAEQIVLAVLHHLESNKHSAYSPKDRILKDQRSAQEILRYSIVQKRPELWNRVVRHCGSALETANTYISEAIHVFGLESIKPGLDQVVNQGRGLRARFDVIKVIASKIGHDHPEIVEDLAKSALLSYKVAAVADVPVLVEIAEERGVGVIEANVLSRLSKTGTYDFLIALAKALREYSATLDQARSPSHNTRAGVTKVVCQCIMASIPQWEITTTGPDRGAAVAQAKTSRLPELLDLCLLVDDFDLYKTLASAASGKGSYESRMAFAKALHRHYVKLPQGDNHAEKKTEFRRAIHAGVSAAIANWKSNTVGHSLPAIPEQVDRVRDLIPFCFTIGQPDLCVTFFHTVRATAPYEVMAQLVKRLHSHIRMIKDSTIDDSGSDTISNLREVARLSLETAMLNCETGIKTPSHGGTAPAPVSVAPNTKTNRICELVEICLSQKDVASCVTLFNTLLKNTSSVEARFNEVFVPLVTQLKATLAKHGKTIELEPFASFFQRVISLYLSRILAPRTPSPLHSALTPRSAGCGHCQHCAELKAFLISTSKTIQFRAVQGVRSHLELQIQKARISDLVTTDMVRYGTPHTLVVTKLPNFRAQLKWKKTQAGAAAFVRSIAEDGEMRRLWPDIYNDVVSAVQGTKTFVAPATLTIPRTAVMSNNVTTRDNPEASAVPLHSEPYAGASGSSNVPAATGTGHAPTLAGTKRKNRASPINTVAVIDLT